MSLAKHKLIIELDQVNDEFALALIAFTFGLIDLDNTDETYFAYSTIFWQNMANPSILTYEQYLEYDRLLYENLLQNINTQNKKNNISSINIKKVKDNFEKLHYENNILRLFDQYLLEVEETNSFFDVDIKNNQIIIFLKQPLNSDFENLIKDRLINYFKYKLYNVIKSYDWICQFEILPYEDDNFILKYIKIQNDDNINIIYKGE